MSHQDLAREILETLDRRNLTEGEVLIKTGRSRRWEIGPHGRVSGSSRESGWAIRSTSSRASLFCSGSGMPSPDLEWPEPDGQSMLLPSGQPPNDWQVPNDLDSSLASESEGLGVLDGIERALGAELEGTRLLRGVLDEGTSETEITSSRGVAVSFRSRAASLFLQAVGPWSDASATSLLLAEREIRRFQPKSVAKRLANRVSLQYQVSAPSRERGELLIAPPVATRILSGLLPLLVGDRAQELANGLRDRQGKLGSPVLTLIDDGRFPGGLLEAPVDGEGVPTREVLLVEKGMFRQSLQGWEQTPSKQVLVGCRRRDSWRDLPRLGPSHLYLKPQEDMSVGSLLGSVARGHYLAEPAGGGLFDFDKDRFWIPVCGFEIQQGAATAPLATAVLEGAISAFLHGIQSVARDLTFEPLGGMIGSPTLLVTGLGLRGIAGE